MSATYSVAEEETMLLQKQGIVTVFGSDINRSRACAATSLRRTLSAGMSSKKWVSHDSSFSSSSEPEPEEEAEEERFQIWSTIQRDKKEQSHDDDDDEEINPSVPAPPAKLDTWSSILFDKAKEEASDNNLVTPYVHPLAKRSKSSLSEKSLEICTESLGSETGSDHVFSSDNSNSSPSSESEDSEDEKEQQQHEGGEEVPLAKQNLHHHDVMMKKSVTRCFPPPLPSHHMRSHRDGNGRLFLDAVTVSVSQSNKFCAQRQDGRLVLTFTSDEEEEEEKNEVEELEEEFEEEFVGFEEDDDDVEEGKEYEEDENYGEAEELEDEVMEVEEVEAVIEKAPLSSNVHRLALMMNNKPIGVISRNTKNWSKNFNEVVNFDEVEQKQHGLVAQSLPPRPRVVARLIPSAPSSTLAPVASLNAYDCYWGTNKHNDRGSKVIVYSSGDDHHQQQKLVVMRGKNGDYLVHNSKGCKDSRRSFLFWEPRCIAT